MTYTPWPKRDPIKNCFLVPNEIYHLKLSYGAIAVYGYLLHIEDRKTYQCYAGYKTIGKATGMSENTVRKYVLELEERGLITTEQTTITTQDGHKRNGVLLYHIRPIQEAVDRYNDWQMQRLEDAVAKQKAQGRLSRLCAAQAPLSETGQHPSPTHTVKRDTDPLWAETVSHSKVLSCEKHPQKSGVFEHRNSSEGKDTTPRSKSQVFTFSWAILPRHTGTTTGQPSEAVGRWRGGAAERVSFPVGGKARDMELVTTRTKGSKSVQEKALALLWRPGGHFRPQCGRFPGTEADAFPDRQTCG